MSTIPEEMRERIRDIIYEAQSWIDDDELKRKARIIAIDDITALLEETDRKAREEAEIALARKVLAVSGGHNKLKGFTQAKRLKLLTDKMNEIIPDVFGIVEESQV